jgi:ADP-ribose pyrophosphatase
MEWKTLKTEYLFRDLWFTVRKDMCERPDGKLVDPYYVYEFPEWVTAVALTTDGQVIMERQYRHAAGMTMYEIPGGCVDDTDKDLEMAIARELARRPATFSAALNIWGRYLPIPPHTTTGCTCSSPGAAKEN